MHNFQTFLKTTREAKELQLETVADAINLSVQTIKIIEEADNDSLLQNSSSVLKNQIRRYCEYLEIPEKKIVSMLNKIDVLYYKKSRYGKLKFFDYLNRLAILIIAITIIILVVKHIKENMYIASTEESPKSSIIYTPINYDLNEPDQQAVADDSAASSNVSINQNNVPSSNDEISSGSAVAIESKKYPQSSTNNSMAAHPPATANMNNIVIDDDIDSSK
ncbi:helix-turn-helix domain-containing protein [Francisella philomiragia]|uniref:helix-turn-helix domain-containing protein n=1 Tax=Francisella philomiragia TaxID=28110 RepID=UPI001904F935|nr:helix-turn-helix domain-containing protein [Francisella philomiragia]MBK2093985.1 helix-turn-helix domain-containing protein [Francisella philomiragia]MBK2256455.1 helix-turn-helix domain-containing protein [Francisella philomiragia]MBK2269113.1 helix-turn-helix domain-containing protein [Francisella philomiragia]MBK2270413.1 helix-turn-helix domain-containing protein [Francisella philomiragia]MBK2274192.1 helix-turn-helix domain-containing protein [Francisella philomiragia]